MKTSFWERRKFFDAYGSRPDERLAKLPPRGMRVTCPCCGYPTLIGPCERCLLCDWNYEEQDESRADEMTSWGDSLVDARRKFETYLVTLLPASDTRIGDSDTDREEQIKFIIIEAFHGMMRGPSPDELNRLWRVVEDGEQELKQAARSQMSGPLYEPMPCPYCGKPLRTAIARQCRFCRIDWHDPDQLRRLPGS